MGPPRAECFVCCATTTLVLADHFGVCARCARRVAAFASRAEPAELGRFWSLAAETMSLDADAVREAGLTVLRAPGAGDSVTATLKVLLTPPRLAVGQRDPLRLWLLKLEAMN